MNKVYLELVARSIKNQLSQEDFLEQFNQAPADFCALRLNEFASYSDNLVHMCVDLIENDADKKRLKEHFGIN